MGVTSKKCTFFMTDNYYPENIESVFIGTTLTIPSFQTFMRANGISDIISLYGDYVYIGF